MEQIVKWRKKLLSPVKGSSWASEMVLNPAIIRDSESGRIHMLFRATGPWPQAQLAGKPLPFPIFLGYGYSDDGESFCFDLENPALSPLLEYEKSKIRIKNINGEAVVNYANGCIEDPRLFFVENVCYLTVACRMFPPGPYWEKDDPVQCMPEWALGEENPYNTQENPTVTALYRVDLKALSSKNYKSAFKYITNLTNPVYGQDRDVVLFPEKMRVDGEMCYVMLHRPVNPDKYKGITEKRPSVFISAAKEFEDFAADNIVKRTLIFSPKEKWQSNRVGVSVPPIRLNDGRWLINYHGKQDDIEGYGQSFFIMREKDNDLPFIEIMNNTKMIECELDFEQPSRFSIPCVFFTGMIEYKGDLLVSYGAADEHVGLMQIDFRKLMKEMEKEKTE